MKGLNVYGCRKICIFPQESETVPNSTLQCQACDFTICHHRTRDRPNWIVFDYAWNTFICLYLHPTHSYYSLFVLFSLQAVFTYPDGGCTLLQCPFNSLADATGVLTATSVKLAFDSAKHRYCLTDVSICAPATDQNRLTWEPSTLCFFQQREAFWWPDFDSEGRAINC